jgi:hypothetical protein
MVVFWVSHYVRVVKVTNIFEEPAAYFYWVKWWKSNVAEFTQENN